MKLEACKECGLIYDLNYVNVPSQDRVDFAMGEGNTDGICEWNGDTYVPVFKCHCGEYIALEE